MTGSDSRWAFPGTSFAWLLLAVFAATTWSNPSEAQTVKVSGDMRLRPDALPKSKFDAIVAEATAVAALSRGLDAAPLPPHWNTLDPSTLAAMISMPSFPQIDMKPRGVLLDQAASWDMLEFRRPSDAAVLWERLWPRPAGGDPKAAPDGADGIEWTPAPTWSDNAFAMMTLFDCFPAVAWSAPGDATIAAKQSNVAWQWLNWEGWDGFRECAMQTNQHGWKAPDSQPSVQRFNAVVAILTTKFEDELSKDRCTRNGPDSCLLIFQALFSLDRHNPKLASILKRMEPAFHFDQPIMIPALPSHAANADPTKKARRNKLSDQELAVFNAPIEEMQYRDIFLTLKLPVLLDQPQQWKPGELDRTLEQAMALSVLAGRLKSIELWRWGRQDHPRYFDDPWQWIDATHADAVAAGQLALGASYARGGDCSLAKLEIKGGTSSFLTGYEVENLRQGHADCGDFLYLRLPETYQFAIGQKDVAAQTRAMAALQPIAAMLTTDGPLREQALDAMTATCIANKTTSSIDPWNLCAGVAARVEAQAQAKRASDAAAQAEAQRARYAMAPADPYVCANELVLRAAKALHYAGDADFWSSEQTACRVEPWNNGEAIVALTYEDGEQLSGQNSSTEDVPFDLDVVIMRTDTGEILAHRHDKDAIDSDAVRFEGLSIDTARYDLAPGRRAFGVTVSHTTHCHDCEYEQSDVNLYLQDGARIDALLQTMVSETVAEATTECPDTVANSTRTLKVDATASHGLADLLLITRTVAQDDQDEKAVACIANSKKAATTTVKAAFDGTSYAVPDGIDPPFH